MSYAEELLGNVIAGLLIMLLIVSFFYNIFLILFRDGRNASMYGSRGSAYRYEGE